MKIKNRKNEFKTIRFVGKDKYIVAWDFTPLFKNGKETNVAVWEEYCFNHKPSIDEIKEVIISYYNNEVDKKILSGYQWENYNIWLSSENQFNYKAAYDIAIQTNGANLPLKFKFGDNTSPEYYEFNNLNKLTEFYMGAITHIQTTLNEGWKKKDNINWEIYKIK